MKATFKLEDFEGPLDLLLYLIEKNKMSIYDIEIASITDQYMDYIEKENTLELEQMSEFIVMAATLLYIKSKMLLPKPPKADEVEEDPREELVRKLLEYKKIKYVAEELDERQINSADYGFRNHAVDVEIEEDALELSDIMQDVTLENLYETFQMLLKQKQILNVQRSQKIDHNILKKDTYTIEQKSSYILNLLELKGEITFFEVCHADMPKIELIVTFMALLELVHKKQIMIEQEKPLDDIIMKGVNMCD
ncbi:MAG: ScpA family protein [Cellulosilyticaceae bacterium]